MDRYENAPPPDEWVPEARSWCEFCCTPSCGCPHEKPIIPANIELGSD